MEEPIGLVHKPAFMDQEPVPLKSIKIDADVKEFVAKITMTQEYVNTEKQPIEVTYYFPIEESAAVTGCRALLGDETIEAEIQETRLATRAYEEAIITNHGAFKLTSARPDIFEMKLGNLEAGANCSITIEYVMELERDNERTMVIIPTTIAPKYVSDRLLSPALSKMLSNIVYGTKSPAPLTINIKAATGSDLIDIVSPTHKIKVTNGNTSNKTQAFIEFEGTTSDMDRDLIISIGASIHNEPKAIMEKNADGTTVMMLTWTPHLNLKEQMGEFIFLVDCSGSMHGHSIEVAREALKVLIHSLPESSYFNIIRFGSFFTKMFGKSEQLDQDSLSKAKLFIDRINTDLGGTEIYSALEHIFKLPMIVGKPRQVFILTDGEVGNTTECIKLTDQYAANNRVFTLGIGSSADRHLVKGIARVSGGTYSFADDKEDVTGKMVKQLKNALQPCIFDAKLSWDEEGPIREFCQAPTKMPHLYDETQIVIYRTWTEDLPIPGFVKISAITPEGPIEKEIKIVSKNRMDGDLLHKMFARKMIQELEERGSNLHSKSDVDFVITKLGLKFKLASTLTSFVGISTKRNSSVGKTIQRMIPNQIPHQFASHCGNKPGCPPPGAMSPNYPPPSAMTSGLPPPGAIAPQSTDSKFRARPRVYRKRWGPVGPGAAPPQFPMTPHPHEHQRISQMTAMFEALGSSGSRNRQIIQSIASIQRASGIFRTSQELEEKIGEDKIQELKNHCEGKMIIRCHWWTALVIAYVEKYFAKEKDIWELFIKKARNRLDNEDLILKATDII